MNIMKRIPQKVRSALVAAVCIEADRHGYMNRDRVQNGIFMDNLLKNPEIGGRLSEYINKSKLKTYIKDSILNRYAKDKTATELTTDTQSLIQQKFGSESIVIESGLAKNNRLSLHRLKNDDLLIVSGGTLLKWETALRKALDFIAKSPKLPPTDKKLNILLVLATAGRSLTTGDKELLSKSLKFIGVEVTLV